MATLVVLCFVNVFSGGSGYCYAWTYVEQRTVLEIQFCIRHPRKFISYNEQKRVWIKYGQKLYLHITTEQKRVVMIRHLVLTNTVLSPL